MVDNVWLYVDFLIFCLIRFGCPQFYTSFLYLSIYLLCQKDSFKPTTTQQVEEF